MSDMLVTKGAEIKCNFSGSYASIGSFKSFQLPKVEAVKYGRDPINVTSDVVVFGVGRIQGGQLTAELWYSPDVYSALLAVLRVSKPWQYDDGDGGTITWDSGYLMSIGEVTGGGPDEDQMFKITVEMDSLGEVA